ncbi:MAG: cupin domain-containing protein [Deltaproteobacteria bacterium]|nr:cupin domain-containing protein [Candidatus Anaeroferrophillus wilburensis]MBN2890115.1 cupin domain-containing protein [Deltaproteobacteria bacterium]
MNIGSKIKKLRLSHSLTQEELAGRSDLTKGFISQLERDLASPSIATLKDILDVFSVSLADFFREADDDVQQVVFGRTDRKTMGDEGADIQLLMAGAHENKFDVALVTLVPGQWIEDSGHEGEEFGFMLKGRVCITLELGQTYTAGKDECFFFPANQQHKISNSSTRVAQFLWVVSPPTFF